MKIGVDLDDTLSRSTEALIKFHNDTYGTNYIIEGLKKYIWEIWADTDEKRLEKIIQFETTDLFINIKPIDNALETLLKIKEGNEFYIITGRSNTHKKLSEAWVNKN